VNIAGEQGIRTFGSIYTTVPVKIGDIDNSVKYEIQLGDTALFRPKNLLIPVGIVVVAGVIVGGYLLLGPAFSNWASQWSSNGQQVICFFGGC
jgi:hypothetical protein